MAFGTDDPQDLHNFNGAPEYGNGLGWYSSRCFSYREWHRVASARYAFEEQANSNTRVVFNLLVGGLQFPWLAFGFGTLYLLTTRKIANLMCDDRVDGVASAQNCKARKIRYFANCAISVVAIVSIGKCALKSLDIDLSKL